MRLRSAIASIAALAAASALALPGVSSAAAGPQVTAEWKTAPPASVSAGAAFTRTVAFSTASLTPNRYVITLPLGATRPTGVSTKRVSGCTSNTSPALTLDASGRWTITVKLSCKMSSSKFEGTFSTNLTRAGSSAFGWLVAQSDDPAKIKTGTLSGPSVIAGPLASVSFAASPTSIVANGTATSTLTASPIDAYGNAVTATISYASAGFASAAGTPEPATDPAASAFTGTTATLTAGTRLGSWTGSVRATQGTITRTSGPVVVTLTRGPLDSLSAGLAYADPLEADGAASISATITAKDAQGRTLTGQAVTASTNEPGAGTPSAVVDNNDGTYSSSFTVGTTSGSYTFTASSGAVSTTAGYATAALGPATVDVTLDPTTAVPADGSSTFTASITVKDKLGQGVAGKTIVVTTDEPGATVSSVTDNGGGSYTATVTVGTTAGGYTLTAAIGAVSGPATYSTSALPPTAITVAASPASGITADGASLVTANVSVKDTLGNGVVGQTVTVSTNEPGATVSSVTDNGGGSYSATITVGTTVGDYTITAAVGALSSTAGYKTTAPEVTGVLTRGEAPPYGDYWSSRDGAPILAGSTDNSFRVTYVASRQFSGSEVTFTIPTGVGVVIGRASSGTCTFGGNSIIRQSNSALPGAVVLVIADCAAGETISLDFTARSSTPFAADQAFQFETRLDYFDNQVAKSETTPSSFTVSSPGHSLDVVVGDKHAHDAFTRTITVNVLGTDGLLDTAFQGSVEFARARCGEPGLPGDGEPGFNPGWAAYPAVNGVATFDITSPDKGIVVNSETPVLSPTSTDLWLARTASADSLAVGTDIELGPDGGPDPGTFTCPTRSGF